MKKIAHKIATAAVHDEAKITKAFICSNADEKILIIPSCGKVWTKKIFDIEFADGLSANVAVDCLLAMTQEFQAFLLK